MTLSGILSTTRGGVGGGDVRRACRGSAGPPPWPRPDRAGGRASNAIAGRVADDLGQRLKHVVQLVQLARAIYLGVRGKDLFGQRCAGARKTDDKHRPRDRTRPSRAPGQELRGETGDDLIDKPGMLVGIIGQAARELAGGLVKVGDARAARPPGNRARAGQIPWPGRSASKRAIVVGERLVARERLHRRDLGVGQPAEQVGRQSPVGFGQARAKRQGCACRLARQLKIAALGVDRGERHPRDRPWPGRDEGPRAGRFRPGRAGPRPCARGPCVNARAPRKCRERRRPASRQPTRKSRSTA